MTGRPEQQQQETGSDSRRIVNLDYTDHGMRAWRRIIPIGLFWGAGPAAAAGQEQWHIRAMDLDRDKSDNERLFALCAIHEWRSTWP